MFFSISRDYKREVERYAQKATRYELLAKIAQGEHALAVIAMTAQERAAVQWMITLFREELQARDEAEQSRKAPQA